MAVPHLGTKVTVIGNGNSQFIVRAPEIANGHSALPHRQSMTFEGQLRKPQKAVGQE